MDPLMMNVPHDLTCQLHFKISCRLRERLCAPPPVEIFRGKAAILNCGRNMCFRVTLDGKPDERRVVPLGSGNGINSVILKPSAYKSLRKLKFELSIDILLPLS
jgi:hypothetical protein